MHPEDASTPSTPLALVGLGCLFPRAGNRQEFWRVLRRGEDCITEVPPSHWSAADWYDGDPTSPDRTYARVGGFLEPYPFDPTEFNLPPNTLEATDTSQLLALVAAKAALEDAGYGPAGRQLPKERTSVILGVTGTLELVVPLGARLGHPHWRRALREAGVDHETSEQVVRRIAESYVPWQEGSFPGLLGNVVAGRIANRLDLHGTNCVVDAACASSLAAVHLAAAELSSGRSDVVITGGVDTFNDIFMFMCFSKTPALSAEGSIRPFSDDSDGTLLGEGVGIVVLKRLSDAERDGDRIYAVLTGIGTSSDGGGGAIYAPDASGQQRAVERAYREASVDPRTVQLAEAHGTGTKVGDAVEFRSLRSVYTQASSDLQWCALGTVKSQIGHAKAAAGAASLCKVALALHHKVLPPTLKVRRPHPKLDIEHSPFYLNTEARPWLAPTGHPRRAALSSFGFGGSNFHLVLEEHGSQRQAPAWDGSVQILGASGPSRETVATRLEELAAGRPDTLAWRADRSRREFSAQAPWRAVVVAAPAEAPARLIGAAEALRAGREMPPDCFAGGPDSSPGGIAFLFPGQGSQYVGMGRALTTIFPEMLETLQEAEAGLPAEQAPAARLFPLPAFDDETMATQKADLTRTEVAQPALGTVETGMLRVLDRFGVRPQALAGHSYGELVALHAAGRLDLKTLFSLSALRGRLMANGHQDRGSMLAISAPLPEVAALAAEAGVVLANRNHPTQGVLSGSREALARAEETCRQRDWTARPLDVSAAFHSPLMEDALPPFAEALAQVPFPAGRVPVYANATAAPYPDDPEDCRNLLANQLLSPVDFMGIVENLYEAGTRTFVEVGPKAVLSGLVRTTLAERPHRTLSLEARGTNNGLESLARTLAELAALGVPVRLTDWEEPASEPRHKRMEVPIVGANYRSPQSRPTPPWEEPKVPAPGFQPAPPYRPTEPPAQAVAPPPAAGSWPPPAPPAYAPPAPVMQVPAYPAPSAPPVPAPAPLMPAPLQAQHPGALGEAFRTIQEGLAAMQALQQQTAAAHQRFLEGQEQVQRVFQSLVAGQQRLAEASLGYAPAGPAPMPPMPPMAYAPPPPMAAPAPMLAPQPPMAAPAQALATPAVAAPVPMAPPPPLAAPAPVAPPAPGRTGPDLSRTILAVVAEKTGYPAEMLRLDMDLEADLGIDSIKRVEILAALEERIPGLSAITPDEIGTLHTLQQVVDRLAGGPERGPGGNGGGAPAPTSAEPAPAPGRLPDAELIGARNQTVPLAERRVLRMQACPAPPETGLPGTGPYLLVDDGDLAPALQRALEKRGATARIVPLPEAAEAASKSSGTGLGGLVLIMPGSPTGAWSSTSERMLKECFRTAAAAAPALKAGPALLATVSRMDGRFGFSGTGFNPVAGGLAGLPKVAALEWPQATCRALDVAPNWPAPEAAEAIASELCRPGPLEVGLSPTGRVTPVLQGAPLEGRVGTALEEGAVVLVTGGARGVTADCARALAAACRPTLVLLGRSPEPGEEPVELRAAGSAAELKAALFQRASTQGRQPRPADLEREARAILAAREIRQTLAELRELGARVHYWPLDVRDSAAVKAVVRRARRELGPIRGLIHAAGVLADRRIEDKTPEQFDSVFDTKVQGLRHLLAALTEDDLHFMAFFSSVTARFGRPGQSDYAMANEVMNKTARLEAARRPGTRVVALGWGPWDGGMVDDSLRREFEKIGVGLIPRDTGAASLVEELRRGAADEVEVILGTGFADATRATEPVEVFRRSLDLASNPILEDHVLAGSPVLPMALMVEWLGEAARQGSPQHRLVGLEGLRVLRPVRIADQAPTVRLLAAAPRPEGSLLAVPVELRLGEVLHARAEALLAEDFPTAPQVEAGEVATTPFPVQGEAAYREFLFHGPGLQGLGRIQGWSEKGLEATASRAPKPGKWLADPPSARWLTDPLVLDCALQVGLLWSGVAKGTPSLPLFGGSYRQYRDAFPSKVRLVFQVKFSSQLRLAGDVLVLDKDGLVASWTGIEWALDPSLRAAFAAGSLATR